MEVLRLQITFDITALTPAEKAHIVQFISEYPVVEEVFATIPSFTFPKIEEDEEAPSPETSFGPTLVTPPPPPPPVPATGVTLDKSGLPWDDRIHSSNKAFVSDGTWRKRRGVEDALIAQVEAELKAIMNIPVAPVVPPPPPVAVVVPPPPPPPPSPVATVVATGSPSTTPIVSTAAPTTPAAPSAGEPNAYLNLIQLVTDVCTKKQLTREQVDDCIKSVDGSLNLQLLSKRPDLIPQIAATIRTLAA